MFFAFDVFILGMVTFIHMGFLISMGTISAGYILLKLSEISVIVSPTSSTSNDVVNQGWILLFFGMLNGITNYVAGEAITLSQKTIQKMIGFTGDEGTSTSTQTNSKTTIIADNDHENGTTTTTTTTTTSYEEKKNFFDLFKIWNSWTSIFISQRLVEICLPYSYLLMLEGASVLSFTLMLFFYPNQWVDSLFSLFGLI